MTNNEWLTQGQTLLAQAGVTTARLDCLVLLEDATDKDRAWLLAHPEFELTAEIKNSLDTKIVRRSKHVPLAYIRSKAEFYGRTFKVNEHTLVPRPETETMIELLHRVASDEWKQMSGAAIADIGTGSGALAVTAKLEFPEAQVVAIDIDENCLHIARENAKVLGTDIMFLHGNLLEPLPKPNASFTILLCNLPYVPEDFHINTAATHEPHHAIFGGVDGLDYYREMFTQIATPETRPFYIFTEALPPQHEGLAMIAHSAGYTLDRTEDFIQLYHRR